MRRPSATSCVTDVPRHTGSLSRESLRTTTAPVDIDLSSRRADGSRSRSIRLTPSRCASSTRTPPTFSARRRRRERQSSDSVPGALRLTDKVDRETGRLRVSQGVIAGCAGGTYDNLSAAADILRGHSIGCGEFALSAYPASQPVFARMLETGIARDLMLTGATLRSAFCGPCFGAGDVPANGGLSIRHTTRNFPNREGSKPGEGQMSGVALMDARSIAATGDQRRPPDRRNGSGCDLHPSAVFLRWQRV